MLRLSFVEFGRVYLQSLLDANFTEMVQVARCRVSTRPPHPDSISFRLALLKLFVDL